MLLNFCYYYYTCILPNEGYKEHNRANNLNLSSINNS